MSATGLSDQTEAVRRLMHEASERFIMPRFQKLKDEEVIQKAKGEGLVTVADLETERFLTENLAALEAGSLVIGEEAVAADPSVLNAMKEDAPVWVIDPVDGTRNFTNASEHFCVMISKIRNDEFLQSWIYNPLKGTCCIAETGSGAYEVDSEGKNARRLKTKSWHSLDESFGRISFGWYSDADRRAIRERADRTLSYRKSIGSAGCEYAFVAKGELDYVVFNRLKVWDHAAGALLVQEAGGSCGLLSGGCYKPSTYRDGIIVGANQPMVDALKRLLFDPVLRKLPEDQQKQI